MFAQSIPSVAPPPASQLDVAVIDDDPLLLQSVANVLAAHPSFACPRTFTSASVAIRALALRPAEVALVDLDLGLESGHACIDGLRACGGGRYLVAYTVSDDAQSVAMAMAAGAHGYLVKGATVDDIVEPLLQVRAGRPPVSPVAMRHILRSFRRPQDGPEDRLGLSPMEWRILVETAAGLDCKAIARRLNIALGTVYVHNRRILRKLGVHSRLAAVARYRERTGDWGVPPPGD